MDYVADTKQGVFEVVQFQIGLRPTPVTMITKSWLFGHKISYNSVCVGEKCQILIQVGVLGIRQCNGII